MNDYQLAAKAADIIEERGHCKGVLEDKHGRVCAFGALNVADHGTACWAENTPYLDVIGARVLKYATGYRGCLAIWNNKPERTPDEVIAALRSYAASEPVTARDAHTYEIK